MKTVFVASYWYGNTGVYCRNALTSLGIEAQIHWGQYIGGSIGTELYGKLKRFDPVGRHLWKIELERTNRSLVNRIKTLRPELIIVNCPGAIYPETLIEIKKISGAKLICWSGDDPRLYKVSPYAMAGLKYYDFHFVSDKSWYCNDLREAGMRKIYFLPYGVDTSVFRPVDSTNEDSRRFRSVVAHLGVLHTNRLEILAAVPVDELSLWGAVSIRAFIPKSIPAEFRCSVRSGKVGPSTANRIYNFSDIVLNLHHPQLGASHNPKTFEIAGSGGFQLSNSRDSSAEFFTPGEELVLFRDPKELGILIEHYRQRPEERRQIAGRAHARAIREHTYAHRMRAIIETVL